MLVPICPLQLRESLVQTLSQVPVQTVESLQQTSAALTELTKAPAELAATAQLRAASLLENMAGFLVNQTQTAASSETSQATGKSVE